MFPGALGICWGSERRGAHPLQSTQRVGHPGRCVHNLIVRFACVSPTRLGLEAGRGRKAWPTRQNHRASLHQCRLFFLTLAGSSTRLREHSRRVRRGRAKRSPFENRPFLRQGKRGAAPRVAFALRVSFAKGFEIWWPPAQSGTVTSRCPIIHRAHENRRNFFTSRRIILYDALRLGRQRYSLTSLPGCKGFYFSLRGDGL